MRFRLVVTAFLMSTIAMDLKAWKGDEHAAIGYNGYGRACVMVRMAHGSLSDAAGARLRLACGIVGERVLNEPVAFTYAPLAGDWSRLAADHTDKPEQLTSSRLGDLVVGYGQMASIAINNYRHFHPNSVLTWRRDHSTALKLATAAVTTSGADLAEAFERALAAESFAQHYLQDAFASGHMGFNRIASSNATSLAYHNRLSRTGRCVTNENGEAWYTFGDGHFWDHDDEDGRRHVTDAAAASYADFLDAFIMANTNSDGWQTVWRLFPATFSDPARPITECRYTHGWPSLREVGSPAPGVSSIELYTVSDASIYRPAARAIMIAVSRDTRAPITIGYRAIHTRWFAALGGTVRQIGPRELYLDWGAAAQVGTSARGTFTHEVGFGESFVYSPHNAYWRSYHSGSVRVFYGLRIEAGPIYIRAQAGGAAGGGGTGPHVSMGLGLVGR